MFVTGLFGAMQLMNCNLDRMYMIMLKKLIEFMMSMNSKIEE